MSLAGLIHSTPSIMPRSAAGMSSAPARFIGTPPMSFSTSLGRPEEMRKRSLVNSATEVIGFLNQPKHSGPSGA